MGGTGSGKQEPIDKSAKAFAESESAPLIQTGCSRPASLTASEVAVDVGPSTAPPQLEPCSSHKSLCSSGPEKVIGTCRICFEQETSESQDPANPLICPCKCSGSSKFVHRQCLQQWRQTNHRADAYWQCEVCHYRYRYQRLWYAHVLGHQITLMLLFTLLMAAFIIVLGFIPITNGLFKASSGGSSSSSSSGGGDTPASPAPGGGSGDGSSSSGSSGSGISVPYPVMHTLNGVVMLGVVGLMMSLMLLCARACGLPALVVFPDTLWCPCVWCLELNGNGAPLLGECMAASGGECCIALGAVVAAVMLVVGMIIAAYMLYIVLWLLVQTGLSRAQHMVENVQQEGGQEDSSKDAVHA